LRATPPDFASRSTGVIVLADAEQLPDQAANRYAGRSVLAQLRQADVIVLNKVDLPSPERLPETRALIARPLSHPALIGITRVSANSRIADTCSDLFTARSGSAGDTDGR